jgi:alpha-ketoglutarate-dependent taurine dioxygenase
MIVRNPASGEETLRFAEPVHDLNPVTLEIHGIAAQQREAMIAEMAELLRKPKYCVAHAWRSGDVLIADNYVLLHGRNAFVHPTQRHIRRVNIL